MKTVAEEGKTPAIVAYLTIIGTIIAYFMNNENKNPFASFQKEVPILGAYFQKWFSTIQ